MKRFLTIPLLLSAMVLLLAGCGLTTSTQGAGANRALAGSVHGGQQPVAGATVNLMNPGTSGYGSAPTVIATTTTDGGGGFELPAYQCPSFSGLVYLQATGGDSGSGTNLALNEVAILGPCGNLTPSTFIGISEVSTVASAFALAPFAAVSPTGTGIGSGSNYSGIANAFGPYSNLVGIESGNAQASNSNMVLPQPELNTLANILASCVNSTGSTAATAACGRLFTAATPPGGTAPIDTFQAAIDIATNPANNAATLFALATASAPFQPTLTTAPADFTLAIQYIGGGINGSYGTRAIAIDSDGSAWIAVGSNSGGRIHQVTEISAAGTFLSGSTGYASSVLSTPVGIAIDGEAYVTDISASKIFAIGGSGSIDMTLTNFGFFNPGAIAAEGNYNLVVGHSSGTGIARITPSGSAADNLTPYSTPGTASEVVAGICAVDYNSSSGQGYLTFIYPSVSTQSTTLAGRPISLAVATSPSSNVLWYTTDATAGGSVVKLDSCFQPDPGVFLSVPLPLQPQEVIIDGLGNVWVSTYNSTAQSTPGALLAYSSSGTLLSPANGFTANGTLPPVPGPPNSMAADGSGNLWLSGSVVDSTGTRQANAFVTELIGAVAPVVTPIQSAVRTGTLGTRP